MAVDFVLTRLTEHFRALLSSTIFEPTAKRAAENQTKRPGPIDSPAAGAGAGGAFQRLATVRSW